MTDKKISQLSNATTPLAGTEVLPIVQSGSTVKVSVDNLTAGKTVKATTFDTDVAAAKVTLSGTTLAAAGTDTNIGVVVNPKGTGGFGVGGDTSGVVAGVTVTSKFCVKNEGSSPVAGFVHVNDTTAGSGSGTFACRSRGTTASPAIVQDNDALWNMFVAGHDGTDLALAAKISVEVDGTPGSDDMPSRLIISTTPDGTQAPVEALRIDSAQNVKVSAGNLVIGTVAKGIDFSANTHAAGMTSELLNWYEEGTWTPSDQSGAGLTFASVDGYYTRIGRQVFAHYYITYPVTADASANAIGGLPFTAANVNAARGGSTLTYHEFNAVTSIYGPKNGTGFQLVNGVGNALTNATCSGKTIMGCIVYFT